MMIRLEECPDQYSGRALVTVIDLLGFSVAAMSSWNEPGCPPWAWLEHFRNQAADFTRGQKVQVESGSDSLALQPKVLFVADTVVFATALNRPLSQAGFLAVCTSHFARLGLLFKHALSSGFLLRGGMEVGDVRWEGSEILGPAQIIAHHIESKCAVFPRVCLGPTLLDTVVLAMDSQKARHEGMLSQLLDWCKFGEDGLIELAQRAILIDCRMEVAEICSRLSDAAQYFQDEIGVRKKYEWLLNAILQEVPIDQPFCRPTRDQVAAARDLVCKRLGLVLNPHASPSTSPKGGG